MARVRVVHCWQELETASIKSSPASRRATALASPMIFTFTIHSFISQTIHIRYALWPYRGHNTSNDNFFEGTMLHNGTRGVKSIDPGKYDADRQLLSRTYVPITAEFESAINIRHVLQNISRIDARKFTSHAMALLNHLLHSRSPLNPVCCQFVA